MLAQAVHIVQFALIGIVIGGEQIFTQLLNYPAQGPFPSSYEWIRERKFMVGFGAWTLGNSLAQSLSSTGAFEVAYDGHLVYSKLAPTSGDNLPTVQRIVSSILRINPTLASSPPPLNHRQSHRPQRQTPRTKPHASSSTRKLVSDDDDEADNNRDLHDMAYDE